MSTYVLQKKSWSHLVHTSACEDQEQKEKRRDWKWLVTTVLLSTMCWAEISTMYTLQLSTWGWGRRIWKPRPVKEKGRETSKYSDWKPSNPLMTWKEKTKPVKTTRAVPPAFGRLSQDGCDSKTCLYYTPHHSQVNLGYTVKPHLKIIIIKKTVN